MLLCKYLLDVPFRADKVYIKNIQNVLYPELPQLFDLCYSMPNFVARIEEEYV